MIERNVGIKVNNECSVEVFVVKKMTDTTTTTEHSVINTGVVQLLNCFDHLESVTGKGQLENLRKWYGILTCAPCYH